MMVPSIIRYRGGTYRRARTRDDVLWAQVAETAGRLVQLAESEVDATSKRELVSGVYAELKERISRVGLW
ncbi:hypothetical protein LCGC14_2035450 [marine sediment metagenome]|uniref:Uncharacterized protein n=1 Tax=marine sediment metagenome TaxID=412755 RepID=A0A0F9FG17_9ZZZZ